MRSSNPVFSKIERDASYSVANEATYGGITLKTILLLFFSGCQWDNSYFIGT